MTTPLFSVTEIQQQLPSTKEVLLLGHMLLQMQMLVLQLFTVYLVVKTADYSQ